MKKWIYKFIFSIVLVALGLFMLPKREVKAYEPPSYQTLIKADLVEVFYEKANASTHEYLVQYVIDGVAIDTINDYFFTFIHYSAINKGYDIGRNSYELELVEIGYNPNDWTLIHVRFTFTSPWLNQNYGGYDYINVYPLFAQNSALYVTYDVYSWGYGDGFKDGRDYGRGMGYQEGYVDGHYEGYWEGYDAGKIDGYDEGYEDGELDGYDDGYTKGYNKGLEQSYDVGYNAGFNDGKAEGFEIGQIAGYNDGYAVGYSDGLSETTDKNFGRLLGGVFAGIGAFLGINLLPGISIGAIIAVPIIFGIIAFIIGKRKD